jgi:DNA polymerase
MTDPRDLLARYLEQRGALGDDLLFVARTPPAAGRDEPPAVDAELPAPSRAKAPPPAPVARRMDTPGGKGRRPKRAAPGAGPRWSRDLPSIPPRGMVIPSPSSDLFSADPLAEASLDDVAAAVRDCTQCRLCENRTNAVPGEGPGDTRLVVVGEGPGAVEDETGRPFVGRAGDLLTEILAAIELPREQVFICNVVKCRPPKNRKPQQDEIDACVPYLHRQLAVIKPAVILAMGGTAAETLLNTRQSLGTLRNQVHEFRGTPLVVTYHPAALLRNPHWKKPTWDDVRIARQLVEQR